MMKTRFQAFAFGVKLNLYRYKRNLYRYDAARPGRPEVRLCRLNQVDP
jgi:hypothetical protein